jgi:imidazole glycerol-phosphate synthase subunit HisH
MISIVDYGMGNLRSVHKALEKLGNEAQLVSTAREIGAAERLIVPGVGAFGDAMKGLAARGLIEPIRAYARTGRPVLGICLGMQIMFEESEEDPGVEGLGIVPGNVVRFRTRELKVPHMGWNSLEVSAGSRLLAGLDQAPHVYFVHSYFVAPRRAAVAAATTEYGGKFVAAIESGNIMGTQFHPEKSQDTGLRILTNFANWS